MAVHPFPPLAAPKASNFINPLAAECNALKQLGLSPISVVMHARITNCRQYLKHCFPRMPESTVDELMSGAASLICDRYNDWVIVRQDPAGVVVP